MFRITTRSWYCSATIRGRDTVRRNRPRVRSIVPPLDPGRKANELFRVEGIPKSFIYNRDGSLVAQAIDMRTQGQFLAMWDQAGPAIRGSRIGPFLSPLARTSFTTQHDPTL